MTSFVIIFAMVIAGTNGQSIADLLQRHNNNLLQQTMMRNMRNQVDLLGSGGGGTGSQGSRGNSAASLMDQLSANVNRMTQSLMDNMRSARLPSLGSDSSLLSSPTDLSHIGTQRSSVMPTNVLFGQQRNRQPQSNQPHTVFIVPMGSGGQWNSHGIGSTITAGHDLSRSHSQADPRDNVNIVIVEKNETLGNGHRPVTRTQTTRITGPPISAKNASLDSILTRLGFGGFPGPLPTTFSNTRNPSGTATVGDFIVVDDNTGRSQSSFNTNKDTSRNRQNKSRRPNSVRNSVRDSTRSMTGRNRSGQSTRSGQPSNNVFPRQTRTETKSKNSQDTSRQTTKTSQNNRNTGRTSQNELSRTTLPPITVPGRGSNTRTTSRGQPTTSRHGINLLYSQEKLTCSAEFQAMQGHTLCMNDKPDVTRSGVVPNDKMFITQFHNDLRSQVQPPAEDLLPLQWDERLASVAEKWAKQCVLAHDEQRKIPDIGMSVGQNVAVGFETWQEAIQMWYDEINMYRYGEDPDSYLGAEGWRKIAHFTQMVQNGTYLIGCGYAECPNTRYKRFYVCNYAAGQSDLSRPYTAGARCGKCPGSCINGLCNCEGLVCQNKGRLDPSTCKCECPKPYIGASCEQVDCPAEDNWICGRDWPASYCDRFFNVPEECPHMCGICSGGKSAPGGETGIHTQGGGSGGSNMTFTSEFGCRYTGTRDDQATCRSYGDQGNDMKMCASQGGTVGCEDCERYFNIKKDYCPVMCGICAPPCGGKLCSNGGTLDTTTCTCACRKPFTGDTCEFAQCPVDGDPGFCRFWPKNYCQMYYNVPEECPYRCGICKKATSISSAAGGTENNAGGGPEPTEQP